MLLALGVQLHAKLMKNTQFTSFILVTKLFACQESPQSSRPACIRRHPPIGAITTSGPVSPDNQRKITAHL